MPRVDLTVFYGTASAASFTLLGFWWIVVDARHGDLTRDRGRRLLAFAVALHFILPGVMSLGALLTGDTPGIWRLTFGGAGLAGLLAVLITSRRVHEPTGVLAMIARAELLVVPLYLVLTLVALRPDLVRSTIGVEPLQVEGMLLTLLVLLGILFAWAMFTEPRPAKPGEG